jgi:hypothetical protein
MAIKPPHIVFQPSWIRHGGGWVGAQAYVRRGSKWVIVETWIRHNGKWVKASTQEPF